MGLIKNQSVAMGEDRVIEVAGTRCKLYGIQVGVYSSVSGTLSADVKRFDQASIDPDNGRNVQLRTGSSTGAVLFDVAIPFVTYFAWLPTYVGEMPYAFNLDPNYVLFDDGIFMDKISDAAADDTSTKKLFGTNVQLSLFYEI